MPKEVFNPPLPPDYSSSGSFGTQASIPNVFETVVTSTVTIPELSSITTPQLTDLLIIQRGNDTKKILMSDFIDFIQSQL